MTDAIMQGLHEREESRIRRFFSRRLRNREDAVDATQETFMRMLEASRSTLIENPQAYLFQVARSVARVASERAARERAMFVEDSEGLEHAEDRPIQDRIVNARQCLLIGWRGLAQTEPIGTCSLACLTHSNASGCSPRAIFSTASALPEPAFSSIFVSTTKRRFCEAGAVGKLLK